MKARKFLVLAPAVCLLSAVFAFSAENLKKPSTDVKRPFRVVQISDLHIGLRTHPESEAHTRQAIALINQLKPDLVLVTGDMSENYPEAREGARRLLQGLQVPYKVVPGNHDVHDDDMSAHRAAYGKDFYSFEAGGIRFIALNSQLMGNFDKFDSPQPVRNAGKAAQESEEMFEWLASLLESDKPTIVFQHIPITYDGAPDNKPYWGVADPYRKEEIKQLKRLRVKDMFAGHWHNLQTKTVEGITVHIAPAVSYGIKTDQIGIVMHTIEPSGHVTSELIPLEMAQ
jgi:3',5'-cyclic AMP phosphodiesterase CpdA